MQYDSLIASIKNYITHNNDGVTPILDLICEYCLRNGLDETMIGDAISEDEDLTKLIQWNMSSKHNDGLENF